MCQKTVEGIGVTKVAEISVLFAEACAYVVPDFVHVLVEGRIVRSGGPDLALELEETGYGAIETQVHQTVPASS
jgi:Fe-S cluster assembly ATPase SufC